MSARLLRSWRRGRACSTRPRRALANLPDVDVTPTSRMADMERWIAAAEAALGWAPGTFAGLWSPTGGRRSRRTWRQRHGVGNPRFMHTRLHCEGTPTELY